MKSQLTEAEMIQPNMRNGGNSQSEAENQLCTRQIQTANTRYQLKSRLKSQAQDNFNLWSMVSVNTDCFRKYRFSFYEKFHNCKYFFDISDVYI